MQCVLCHLRRIRFVHKIDCRHTDCQLALLFQCSLIKKKIYKRDVNIKSLEILKAYEIQGKLFIVLQHNVTTLQ